MVDQPTSRNRFRKQEVGTNNNTWGTKLNEVIDCIDQVVDGVESVDLGGSSSYTLTITDYTTADQAKNRVLVCSNVNGSGSNLIVPSVEHVYGVSNTGSATITVNTSAGTGVEIPASRFSWVYCDGTNVVSAATTTLPASFAPSLANDPTTVDWVEEAIANASLPATAGTVLVDGADTTAGYLGTKVTGSGAASVTTTGTPGNGSVVVSVGALAMTAGATQTGDFVAAAGIIYPVNCTAASRTATLPAASGSQAIIGFKKFGTFPLYLSGTINGVSQLFPITDERVEIISDADATRGWV